MHLELQTIGACTIKRKKPWPHVTWIGQYNESLLLIDANRCSILYIKDGQTQKKVSVIRSYVASSRLITASINGTLLCGLMVSGDIWLWNKDKSILYTVPGIGPLQRKSDKVHMKVDDGADKILVILDGNSFYLWKRDTHLPEKRSKSMSLVGRWFRVDCSAQIVLPELGCKEIDVDSVMLSGKVLNGTLLATIAFWDNTGSLRISAAAITDNADVYSNDFVHAEWCQILVDNVSCGCKVVKSRGSLVIRQARSLPVCVLAVNQQSVQDTCLLFVSQLRQEVIKCNLHQLGLTADRGGRHYWIADMKWVHDDLLVAVITKIGCLAVVSRLGEPVLISTDGHGVKFSQGRFLPLLPKISVRSKAQENIPPSDDTSQMSERTLMRQRYSINCHSRFPIIILSDGYQVICLELTEQATTRTLALAYLTDSLTALRALTKQQTISFTLRSVRRSTPETEVIDSRQRMRKLVQKAVEKHETKKLYQFEESEGLNESIASLGSTLDGTSAHTFDGAIVTFGSAMHQTLISQQMSVKDRQQLLEHSCRTLSCAWGLLVSSDTWSHELENVCTAVTTSIVKLLGFLLHSEDNMGRQLLTTVSLSSAIRYFSAMFRMISFDSFTTHLLPNCIKWLYNCVNLFLCQHDLKIAQKSLLTCAAFSIIKFAETIINQTYLLFPTHKFSSSMQTDFQQSNLHLLTSAYDTAYARLAREEFSNDVTLTGADESVVDESTICLVTDVATHPAKRLVPVYKLLQSRTAGLYAECLRGKHKKRTINSLKKILSAIQSKTRLHTRAVVNRPVRTIEGDKLYLAGFKMAAVAEWKSAYQRLSERQQAGRQGSALLHAVLYTQLLQCDVYSVLQFVEQLILDSSKADSRYVSEKGQMSSLRLVEKTSVRHIVQTLARFMVIFFTNGKLYVYPPHYPQPLEPVYSQTCSMVPVTGIDHAQVHQSVLEQGLAEVWSLETTVKYLLLSGLISELVWFCDHMGDWKTALSLGIISQSHSNSTMKNKKMSTVHTILPEALKPETIISSVITQLFTSSSPHESSSHEQNLNDSPEPLSIEGDKDISKLTNLIHDIMLPAAIFSLSALSSALTKLWGNLKLTAQKCAAFVPEDVYLPAPALFCVQPTVLDMDELSTKAQHELKWRKELSLLVQYMLIIFRACHVDLPSCGWLIRHMKEAWLEQSRLSVNESVFLPKALEEYVTFHIPENNKTNKLLLVIFHNLCSLLWMSHVRDSLSLMIRRASDLIDQEAARGVKVLRMSWSSEWKRKFEKQLSKRWFPHMRETLVWCVHYLPFAQFLQCENEVCEVIISLAEELPPSEELASIIASSVPDIDSLAPEVKEKMDALLQAWQTENVLGRSDQSLSMFYFEQCREEERIQAERSKIIAFEEHIFTSAKAARFVGTRMFEYKQEYVDFLDLFFSVSFCGSLPQRGTSRKTPLLPCYNHSLQQQHFSDHVTRSVSLTKRDKRRSKSEGNINSSSPVHESAFIEETQFPVMENKAGLYRLKRQNSLEQKTARQLKKLGIHDITTRASVDGTLTPTLTRGVSVGDMAMCKKSVLHAMPSNELLPQSVRYPERYERLSIMLQWMDSWSARHISIGADIGPSAKIAVVTDSVIVALMMIEKRLSDRESGHKKVKTDVVVKSSDKVKGSQWIPPERSASPIQKVVASVLEETYQPTLTAQDEEERDREAVLLEMKKHAELPVATTPINQVETSYSLRSSKDVSEARKSASDRTHTLTTDTGGTDKYMLEDSATTVWSSASLPNLSANSTDPTTDSRKHRDWRSSPEPGKLSPVRHSKHSRHSDRASSGTFSIKSTGDTSSWHTESTVKSRKLRRSHQKDLTDSQVLTDQQHLSHGDGIQSIGSQLQSIVREEMRRIVQLQHQGLSQMLGALGGESIKEQVSSTSAPNRQDVSSANNQSSSMLKLEDLTFEKSSDAAVQTTLNGKGHHEEVKLPAISNLLEEMHHLQGRRYRQPDSVKIPLLSVRPAWIAPPQQHTTDSSQSQLPQSGFASSQQTQVNRSTPTVPLLKIHWSNVQEKQFQVPSFPLLHVHQQAQTQPVPPVAAGPEALKQFDHKKQQRERLKQEIATRFMMKESAAHQERQRKELGKQLLNVDFNQLEQSKEQPISTHRKKVRKSRKTYTPKKELQPSEPGEPVITHVDDVTEKRDHVIKPLAEAGDHVTAEENEMPQSSETEAREHGFAFKPGMFDEYLEKQDELGSAADTFAKVQYKAATGLQPHVPRVHDVGVMTDVAEEIHSPPPSVPGYTAAQAGSAGNILPPEIFCQLDFSNERHAEVIDKENEVYKSKRAFLSVVDVDADSFKDIPLQPEMSHDKAIVDDAVPLNQDNFASVQFKTAMEIAGTPDKEATVDSNTGSADFLTRELLGQKLTYPADYVMPSKLRLLHPTKNKHKVAMAEKLVTMDDQLAAIEHLKQNMESQLKNTRLLLTTAEEIADTQAQSLLRPSTVADMVQPQGEFVTILEPVEQALTIGDLDTTEIKQKKDSSTKPLKAAGATKSSSRMEVSGLSDISGLNDLIGSMVAKGDLNLSDLGLSKFSENMSDGEVLETFRSLGKSQVSSPANVKHRKQEVQEWMKTHQPITRENYRQEVESARKPERRPFQSQANKRAEAISKVKMSKLEKERLARRVEMSQHNLDKRMQDAQQLIASMIHDEEELKLRHQQTMTSHKPVRARKVLTVDNKDSARGVTRRAISLVQPATAHLSTDGRTERQEVFIPGSSRGTSLTLKEVQRIYGSKRIPNLYPYYQKTGERKVKTYTERLKELKPQSPRAELSVAVSTHPVQGRTMREVTRRGMTSRTLSHAPRTYTQQLQSINQNAPRSARHRDAYRPETSATLKSPKMKSQERSRPYADPYRQDEESSLLSPWSVSDDVKRLLDSRYTTNDITEMSDDEISDLEILAAAGLAELRGVEREGSEMSFIDWNAVDQLVAGLSSDRSSVPSY